MESHFDSNLAVADHAGFRSPAPRSVIDREGSAGERRKMVLRPRCFYRPRERIRVRRYTHCVLACRVSWLSCGAVPSVSRGVGNRTDCKLLSFSDYRNLLILYI